MSKVTDKNRHPALTKIKYSEKTTEEIKAKTSPSVKSVKVAKTKKVVAKKPVVKAKSVGKKPAVKATKEKTKK